MTNFRLFKLKEYADDNFKFDGNGRQLFKRVGNTVGKAERMILYKAVFRPTIKSCKNAVLYNSNPSII